MDVTAITLRDAVVTSVGEPKDENQSVWSDLLGPEVKDIKIFISAKLRCM
jgi:hypothetical protein